MASSDTKLHLRTVVGFAGLLWHGLVSPLLTVEGSSSSAVLCPSCDSSVCRLHACVHPFPLYLPRVLLSEHLYVPPTHAFACVCVQDSCVSVCVFVCSCMHEVQRGSGYLCACLYPFMYTCSYVCERCRGSCSLQCLVFFLRSCVNVCIVCYNIKECAREWKCAHSRVKTLVCACPCKGSTRMCI